MRKTLLKLFYLYMKFILHIHENLLEVRTLEEKNHKPYIPADKVVPEFTVYSVALGILLVILFGAANAYLGLRVGMTVSAAIPASVISMASSA